MESTDIYDWIFLILALVIYFDATHHKIGKVKGEKGFLNMTAGGWATVASFTYIGLIAVVLYAVKRKKLLEKAALHPVEIGMIHRILVAGLLFILPMFLSDLLPSASSLIPGMP
jgi:hypothetical protein